MLGHDKIPWRNTRNRGRGIDLINLILAGRKSRHGEDRFHKGSHRLDGLLWLSHDITVVARLDHLVLNVGFRLEGIGHLEDTGYYRESITASQAVCLQWSLCLLTATYWQGN